jgi:hypothetical protein
MRFGLRICAEIQLAQAVPNFGTDRFYAHAGFNGELARESGAGGRALSQVKCDPAVLTIFVPAKPPVGDGLGGEVLEAPQQGIVFRHFELLVEQSDPHQARKWPEERGRRCHA